MIKHLNMFLNFYYSFHIMYLPIYCILKYNILYKITFNLLLFIKCICGISICAKKISILFLSKTEIICQLNNSIGLKLVNPRSKPNNGTYIMLSRLLQIFADYN